jgi:uroporphyrinogen III methyltransferase/synthase
MKIRVGSRESRLAVIQSEIVIEVLRKAQVEGELITMKTSGDMILDRSLDAEGGKGLFTRELDRALLEGHIDLAVHSLKDIPTVLTAGLAIAAFCAEGDPRDALVLPAGQGEMDKTKPIGCAGKRRSVQAASLYPDWPCALIRGNVPTRLRKLDRGEYGALILAAAGLKRLGMEARISRIFEPEELLPSAGQGILALVTRQELEADLSRVMGMLDIPSVRRRALCERAFIKTLGGGCGTPVAAFAREEQGSLLLRGFYAPGDPDKGVSGMIRGGLEEGEELGKLLAYRLLGEHTEKTSRLGKVTLVGAGPGDPGLLTLKGAEALGNADVVVFDKLIAPGILAGIPPKVEKIYVGKEAGNHTMSQEGINELLVAKAAQGNQVVRLKGGDPYLFGRGGEEIQYLSRAGIRYEVIPGIPSALAVPAAGGIPVTHRDLASQVHIISGHSAKDRRIDYAPLVKAGGTLIFLMGVQELDAICRGLLEAGLGPETDAAIIQGGTTSKQRTLRSVLGRLSAAAAQEGIKAPAITIIGEVCRVAQETAQAELKPLAGLRIALTRPRDCPSRLQALFANQGAEVVDLPVTQIVPIASTPHLETVLNESLDKTWFAFTSAHGVEIFFDKLKAYHKDMRSLAPSKFAAVGSATRDALQAWGVIADLTPETFSGAALGAALAETALQDERVILPCSAIAGKDILKPLMDAGIACFPIPVYDTLAETCYDDPVYRELLVAGLDYVAFTSPSAVDSFVRIFPYDPSWRALCIGETTAATARRYGMETLVPQSPSLEGMVQALLRNGEK